MLKKKKKNCLFLFSHLNLISKLGSLSSVSLGQCNAGMLVSNSTDFIGCYNSLN